MSELDRHDFLEAALKQRSIVRDGRDHYEFNMTITSYPERHKLEGHGLPKSEINSILHRKEGIGFYGEVRGYGSRGRVHVKLLTLPFIEVYVQRANDAPILSNDIRFRKNQDDNKFMIQVAQAFYAVKGDATA